MMTIVSELSQEDSAQPDGSVNEGDSVSDSDEDANKNKAKDANESDEDFLTQV